MLIKNLLLKILNTERDIKKEKYLVYAKKKNNHQIENLIKKSLFNEKFELRLKNNLN